MPRSTPSGVADEVTAYLSGAPPQGEKGYERIRALVRLHAGADRVSERLSYQMPTFFVDGRMLLYVGLWDGHLAIYPTPESATDTTLEADLAPYRKGKGTLHFRYSDQWPTELIERIVSAHLERFGR